MIEIRSPRNEKEWEDYFDLRFRVLREPLGQPIGSERNEGDSIGIHFALFKDQMIKAIARLDHQNEAIAQVRFVAVELSDQGMGYGRKIMEAVEETSKSLGYSELILHARDYAVDFYLKQNYSLKEPSYKLFDILQHYLMVKHINE